MKSTEEFISLYEGKDVYTHLGRSQNITNGIEVQLYAWGYNASGRPDGLWIAPNNTWLKYTKEKNDPKYPTCCYLYEVKPDNMFVLSEENFAWFDNKYPSYWLNLDYYDVNFKDKLDPATTYKSRKRLSLDFNRLDKQSLQSLYNILLSNGIIFETAADARSGCQFYKNMSIDTIERFKYKNWEAVLGDYPGIIFKYRWGGPCDKYFWYQTLDVESGCLWDTQNASISLKYIKKSSKWKYNI